MWLQLQLHSRRNSNNIITSSSRSSTQHGMSASGALAQLLSRSGRVFLPYLGPQYIAQCLASVLTTWTADGCPCVTSLLFRYLVYIPVPGTKAPSGGWYWYHLFEYEHVVSIVCIRSFGRVPVARTIRYDEYEYIPGATVPTGTVVPW